MWFETGSGSVIEIGVAIDVLVVLVWRVLSMKLLMYRFDICSMLWLVHKIPILGQSIYTRISPYGLPSLSSTTPLGRLLSLVSSFWVGSGAGIMRDGLSSKHTMSSFTSGIEYNSDAALKVRKKSHRSRDLSAVGGGRQTIPDLRLSLSRYGWGGCLLGLLATE